MLLFSIFIFYSVV